MNFLSGLLAEKRWQWVSPTLSKPDTGKGRFQTVKFIGTRASGHPSWPGVADSTQGRIHWRRPSAILRFSLASLRRTIHTGNPAAPVRRRRWAHPKPNGWKGHACRTRRARTQTSYADFCRSATFAMATVRAVPPNVLISVACWAQKLLTDSTTDGFAFCAWVASC